METISDSSKVYMKCPTCSNPYSVEPLDIVTPQPTFDCFDCGTRFYFQWPQSFQGIEVRTHRVTVPIETEPSPHAPAITHSTDVVEIFERDEKQGVEASWPALPVEVPGKVEESGLQEKWINLQSHWEDEWWHQSFLSACDKKARLSFASGRYAQYLQSHPQDEMAKKMRERLKALSRSDLLSAHKASATSSSQNASFNFLGLLRWWLPACLLVCLMLFMIGYTQPLYRNLIGLSLALAVFAGGIKYFFFQDPER